MKPEFQPAGAGVGTALLALGLASEAKAAFEELLRGDPSNLDSRIGLAAVLGVEGHPEQEIEAYRRLLTEDPDLLPVRAHLLAALIDHHHWAEARDELVTMLKKVPEDGRLRYLYAIALEKTGAGRAAQEEREKARHMGLTPDRERSLAEQLGLTPPRLASIAPPIPAAVLSQPPEVPAELVPGPEPLKPMAQPSGRSHKVRPRRALAPRKRAPRRTPRTDASSGRKAK
jgi:tetratricopeptide (TPR) repeat protein